MYFRQVSDGEGLEAEPAGPDDSNAGVTGTVSVCALAL